jgi:hypothetical protein
MARIGQKGTVIWEEMLRATKTMRRWILGKIKG